MKDFQEHLIAVRKRMIEDMANEIASQTPKKELEREIALHAQAIDGPIFAAFITELARLNARLDVLIEAHYATKPDKGRRH